MPGGTRHSATATADVRTRRNEDARIRVASVPATHVYVRRLWHPEVDRLEDPSGDDLRTPCFLDPDWVDRHADRFDLVHVHFGVEFYDPERIRRLADVLRQHRKPLVFTCHDLRNPNHGTPDLHDRHLDVLMRRADRVVTLTESAAAVIAERWQRHPLVLAHPHVVPLDVMERFRSCPPRGGDGYRLAIHLKSLRANMAPLEVVRAGLDVAHRIDALHLRVDVHHDVLDPTHENHDPRVVDVLLEAAADADAVADLHIHHYLTDDDLWAYLASVDGFLLPYTFGTHSGLLEACRDLGTAVIAPAVGGYAEQGAHHVFRASEREGIDRDDLRRAIAAAVAAGRPRALTTDERAAQRRRIAEAHVALYDELLGAAS